MHKVVVSIVALILSAGVCSNSLAQQSIAESKGVTGATIKRAAVPGGHVDFGTDVNSIENYDLDTQGASVANPVDTSDFARDEEIDSVVSKIQNGGAHPAAEPQAPSGSLKLTPAIPSRPASAAGMTGSLKPSSAPESVGNPAAGEDPAMAAAQARAFPKPMSTGN
ncbi:MAG: hypothetical protein WAW96_09740 [Alphaproteobacteria bacterium]